MANSEREERYVKAFKGVRSTGGAVPVMNDRGEISMEKVKVRGPGARARGGRWGAGGGVWGGSFGFAA